MGAGRRNCSQAVIPPSKNAHAEQNLVAAKEARPQTRLEEQYAIDVGQSSWTSLLEELAAPLLPAWDETRYCFQSVLTCTTSGGGQIELYLDLHTGTGVVAKRFRSEHLCDHTANAYAPQSPWHEIMITQCLGGQMQGHALRGVCTCHGAFRDAKGDVLLVSEYFPGGDLFELASNLGEPGPQREARVWPIFRSFFDAVLSLHSVNVAHGDLSLENALFPDSKGQVVLIDFEVAIMGSLGVATGTRGKPAYQAPEMHDQRSYDACRADLFSCGVVAYMLAIGAYPWTSTKPGVCASFAYAKQHGMEAFLKKKTVRIGSGSQKTPVWECLSSKLACLLCQLLSLEPIQRQYPVDFLN